MAVVIIQLRRGTAAQWTTANTLLRQGEFGWETDTGRIKGGDGVTTWNSLPYATFGITKSEIGLGLVPNVDATQRSNHTGTQTASTISDFDAAADARITAQKGSANGIAPLNASSKIDPLYLPGYVDDVLEYANLASFPGTGESGVLYVALDTNRVYRWSGSTYVEVSSGPSSSDAVPEGSTNLYFTNARVDSRIQNSDELIVKALIFG